MQPRKFNPSSCNLNYARHFVYRLGMFSGDDDEFYERDV